MVRASLGRTLLTLCAALMMSGAAVGAAVGPAQVTPVAAVGGIGA